MTCCGILNSNLYAAHLSSQWYAANLIVYLAQVLLGPSLTSIIQVHADATNFSANLSKKETYTQVYEEASGLFVDQRNWVGTPPP